MGIAQITFFKSQFNWSRTLGFHLALLLHHHKVDHFLQEHVGDDHEAGGGGVVEGLWTLLNG